MTLEEIKKRMHERDALLNERERILRLLDDNDNQLEVMNVWIKEYNIPFMNWNGSGFVTKEKKPRKKKMEGMLMHESLPDLMNSIEEKIVDKTEPIIEVKPEIKLVMIPPKEPVRKGRPRSFEKREPKPKPRAYGNASVREFSMGVVDEREREESWDREARSGFQFSKYPDVMEDMRYKKTK